MSRFFALLLALALTSITVSSTCVAQASEWIRFTLEPKSGEADRIHATFRGAGSGREDNSWSTEFRPAELAGLDLAGFHAAGTRNLHFALVREAGRLDCAGNGGSNRADGNCRFTADAGFNQLLIDRGIGRPRREQAFALMAVNVRREMILAIAAAHYPTPTIEQLIPLSAVGVNGPYITGLARVGYRPQSIDSLIQFRAMQITPEFIGSLSRAGYSDLRPDELVQLKALNITPEFIAGFERIGYHHLPVDKLVQLKAMDITPEFVRAVQQGGTLPSPEHLVQLRAVARELRSR
jgi:hypothetical protein